MNNYQKTIKLILESIPQSQRYRGFDSMLAKILECSIENYSTCREEGLCCLRFSDSESDEEKELFITDNLKNSVRIGFADSLPVYIHIRLESNKYLPLHNDYSGKGFISFYNKDERIEEDTIMSIQDLNEFLLSLC